MPYMSIEECHRSNGDRHAARAEAWIAAGKPEYAAGSMRKARRNWARAEAWKFDVRPELQQVIDKTRDAISRGVFERGTGGNPFEGIF